MIVQLGPHGGPFAIQNFLDPSEEFFRHNWIKVSLWIFTEVPYFDSTGIDRVLEKLIKALC